MANEKLVTLAALKTAVQRAQTEWAKDIAKTGHAHFEKVETVPDAGTAKENVLYLVLNTKTQHYDIYAKVEGAVVLLDDTTVDLTGYATKEQLEAVSGGLGGTVYTATKEDLTASDESVITGYFAQHPDAKPKKGDVFVVVTTVEGSTYEQAAYFYDGSKWAAMTGSVDADKVEKSATNGNIKINGVETQVYKEPSDVVHGSIASTEDITAMLTEVFGA